MSWSEDGVRNAIIKSVTINDADRGMLTAWIDLDYGGSGQGFGGFVLYNPHNSTTNRDVTGVFIWNCMKVGGVSDWSKLPGKAVRVCIEDGLVHKIGHIIEDIWFDPSQVFKELRSENRD